MEEGIVLEVMAALSLPANFQLIKRNNGEDRKWV